MVVTMLTTTDNPYDPFDQFDEWFAFDEQHGYHTCGYIDRIANSSSDLSAADQNYAITKAIEEILRYNVLGIYKKVTRNFEKSA